MIEVRDEPSSRLLPPKPDEKAPSEAGSFVAQRSLKRQLLAELRAGWEGQTPVRAEDLLHRWPAGNPADPDIASLLFEEHCQRRQQGEEPSLAAAARRFPEQEQSLIQLADRQALLRSLGGGEPGAGRFLALPSTGDCVFGFTLGRELGRGSFARVYLAQQNALAGRPVVVKVSAIEGNEPQTLAQLQHTHIVPIYSVHEDEAAGLRVVCMPYFGGTSLSRVLQAVWADGTTPTTGRQLVEALAIASAPDHALDDTAADPALDPAPADSRPAGEQATLRLLASMSYVQAAAWIICRLAEALQHAHQRAILHRDIKPSNVLLSADGEPMLLDFNLAQQVLGADAQAAAVLGGTVAYMAPEHLRALAARDPALVRQVDHRADVYGLGMVLCEILTGRRPFDQSASYSPMPALIEAMAVERGRDAPSLRSLRRDVPWSLESIARKCLAPQPNERYQCALHLAEDLKRFLEDRPLRHAPELSWCERGAKWVRRHPRLSAVSGVVLAAGVIISLGAALVFVTQRELHQARLRLVATELAEAQQVLQQFQALAERARCLINTRDDLQDHTKQGMAACREALALYGALERDDWQTHPQLRRLDASVQRQIAEDVRELLLLFAHAQVPQRWPQTPKPDGPAAPVAVANAAASPEALENALELTDRAERVADLEPSSALWRDRARYLEKLGRTEDALAAHRQADRIPPRSVHDHYLTATSLAFAGQPSAAVEELNQALVLQPRHYWSHLLRGVCYREQGRNDLAAADFGACVALWPEFAWGHFNLGEALQQLGHATPARTSYTEALRCDPQLQPAYLNRGLLWLNEHRAAEALEDFDRALALGSCGPAAWGRTLALEALGRIEEAETARASAEQQDPNNLPLRLAYGFAVARRQPALAERFFHQVLTRDPRNARAWYGCAMLAAERQRDSEVALKYFHLALQMDPTFSAARSGRANVLAHRKQWAQAREDMDWCLKADPSGSTFYAAACVYSLLAAEAPEGSAAFLRRQALTFLKEAFQRGYGRGTAASDSDLVTLQPTPEFKQLLHDAPAPLSKR